MERYKEDFDQRERVDKMEDEEEPGPPSIQQPPPRPFIDSSGRQEAITEGQRSPHPDLLKPHFTLACPSSMETSACESILMLTTVLIKHRKRGVKSRSGGEERAPSTMSYVSSRNYAVKTRTPNIAQQSSSCRYRVNHKDEHHYSGPNKDKQFTANSAGLMTI
ncbi:hypothetical protein STEG23_024545 [Scotinomys teguina]